MDDKQSSIATDASLALINLSSDEDVIPALVDHTNSDIIDSMLKVISDPEHDLADPACMFLSNITRNPQGSQQVFEKMLPSFDRYVDIFCQEKYNKKGAKLHYFAAVFSNLSQIPEMRK